MSLGYRSEDLLDLAVVVAKAAGEVLSQRPEVFDLNQKTSVVDFATQMDHASEKLIVDGLLAARPNDGIIGEEGSERASTSGITWVIDPLDGTVNYFYGLAGWSVSIAAKDESGVVVGVVHSPTVGTTWTGIRGGGAHQNGHPIRCNDPVPLNRALLSTGFAYDLNLRAEQAARVAHLIPKIRDLRRIGSAAVDICHVAAGSTDGYFEQGLNEWDLAAGWIIATEAGAVVTGRSGGIPGKDMVVVAGPALHAELLREISLS